MRENPTTLERPYATYGIQRRFWYLRAITVATENAATVWPEGKLPLPRTQLPWL